MNKIPWKPMNTAPRNGDYITLWSSTRQKAYNANFEVRWNQFQAQEAYKWTAWMTNTEMRMTGFPYDSVPGPEIES
jgi:hypothetical protein